MSYHPTASRIGAVAFVAFALWWLGALVVDGDADAVLRIAPWLAAACTVVYAVFWRPSVVVDEDGVTLRNVLRDVRVPWPALEGVDTRFALTLSSADGRHQSWAAAAPGMPSVLRGMFSPAARREDVPDPRWTGDAGADAASSQDLRADSGAAAFLVTHRWAAWRDGARPATATRPPVVEVRWNVLPIVLFAACVVLGTLVAVGS